MLKEPRTHELAASELAADAARGIDVVDLKRVLLTLFRSPSYRPPLLPAVAVELLELSRKPRVKAAEVAELLGRDPLLAGQVLRMSQSALHSRREPVRSLDQAIVRLGLDRITDLFFAACLELKVFRAPGFEREMESLRAHSVLVAEAARLVSRHSVGFEEYAFLCGLLHDVGIAACIIALSETSRGGAGVDFAQALPCVREIHASSSELLAKIWQLPSDIALVLSLHHELRFEGQVHPLAAAIAVADGLVAELGFGFHDETNAVETETAARLIGLEKLALDRIRAALALLAEPKRAV